MIKLLVAARDIVKSSEVDDEDVVMPQQNDLLMVATRCVIERIGDFELEPQHEAAQTELDAESLSPPKWRPKVYLKSR